MKIILTISLLLSAAFPAIAARHGDACPDGINQVAEYYLDRDASCRAVVLYCRGGFLQQLELPNPQVDASLCQVSK